ncbi:hypothetical protein ACSQ67_014405 [Phaseolus vulgaris]
MGVSGSSTVMELGFIQMLAKLPPPLELLDFGAHTVPNIKLAVKRV